MRRALFALVLLWATPAGAYVLSGVDWTWQDHPIEDPWTIDLASFPADAGSNSEIEGRITAAMTTWNDVDRDVRLEAGVPGAGVLDSDGFSDVFYGSYSGLGGSLAFSSAWSYEDGAAFDCDIQFLDANDNGAIHWSADPGGPNGSQYDMESVALHELGHCLGLDHSTVGTVMYAYYGGSRTLSSDDKSGLDAIYDPDCDDADGDGWMGCDFDCDDANALIHPGAPEVCDGVDGDCDGIVDADTTEVVPVGDASSESESEWLSVGNAFVVNEATTLVSARVRFDVAEGSRLVWSVYASTDAGATWTRIRTDRTISTLDTLQQGPDVYVPLTVGTWYAVNVGAFVDTVIVHYDGTPDLTSRGLVTPVGAVSGRPMADDISTPDATRLVSEELLLVSVRDVDGDGVTTLCGDCDDRDPDVSPDIAERCDGLDQDCDGRVDEDFPNDADGDGTRDCLDPCPEDDADDADGDGACADADPCPDDPTDACGTSEGEGDSGGGDTDVERGGDPGAEPGEGDAAGGCGCASANPGLGAVGVLMALAGVRRRRE